MSGTISSNITTISFVIPNTIECLHVKIFENLLFPDMQKLGVITFPYMNNLKNNCFFYK